VGIRFRTLAPQLLCSVPIISLGHGSKQQLARLRAQLLTSQGTEITNADFITVSSSSFMNAWPATAGLGS